MLFVGKVVHILRQANPFSMSVQASPSAAWPRGSRSDTGPEGWVAPDDAGGDSFGDDAGGGVGVSEAEVLELTQRWSELRSREAFHLLALERAVHEVMSRRRGSGGSAVRLTRRSWYSRAVVLCGVFEGRSPAPL